ncbi:hypothetical protein L6164_033993 [Bauhinia variegata]|uniref:Uncharacterized protein n=1 Tax=Bauhinia variegata TaxID=167791 RepID=A0ACB9KU08_BAUVA|nr:hypothetical protein L6164_033993 [Bauhinia variegata]
MKHWGAIENLLIGCCSSTHDGRIDYGEFVAMMKEGDGGFGRTRTMKVRTLDWRKKSIETVELEDFHRKKCKPTALTRSPQALSSLSLPLASKSKPFASVCAGVGSTDVKRGIINMRNSHGQSRTSLD